MLGSQAPSVKCYRKKRLRSYWIYSGKSPRKSGDLDSLDRLKEFRIGRNLINHLIKPISERTLSIIFFTSDNWDWSPPMMGNSLPLRENILFFITLMIWKCLTDIKSKFESFQLLIIVLCATSTFLFLQHTSYMTLDNSFLLSRNSITSPQKNESCTRFSKIPSKLWIQAGRKEKLRQRQTQFTLWKVLLLLCSNKITTSTSLKPKGGSKEMSWDVC